jgi:hypothetical protein
MRLMVDEASSMETPSGFDTMCRPPCDLPLGEEFRPH